MIYLDNNATTRIAPEVTSAMLPFLNDAYGNPSSAHEFGRGVRKTIDEARENVAKLVGAASPDEIVFTSCGTESDNWALVGAFESKPGKNHAVTTTVEHEAVSRLFDARGADVTRVAVDHDGLLDIDELRRSLRPETAVVSVMMANNETGVIFPVAEIAKIVKENSDALVHVDGVNAVGKIAVDLKNTAIDLFSLSAHKFHGPKGVGALYIRDGVRLPSMLIGGGQESSRRAGTEAVHQIAGIGRAAALVGDLAPMENVRRLRERLETEILQKIPYSRLNGTSDTSRRLPNTSNISFENLNGESILARLSDLGVCVSTGSACHAGSRSASSVLTAMNVPFSFIMGSIRFSLGRYNTDAEIDFVLEHLPRIVADLRSLAG